MASIANMRVIKLSHYTIHIQIKVGHCIQYIFQEFDMTLHYR